MTARIPMTLFLVVSGLTAGCGGRERSDCGGTALCAPPRDPVEPLDTGVEPEFPVALCEVDTPEQFLPDALFAFDGTPSYSPEGLQIAAYEWAVLTTPEGSFAELSSRTGATTVLEGDVLGTFEVQLNVINELGLRSDEPCVIQVQVVEP